MTAPGLTTRREFLEGSAAAAALLALPWAAGCARGDVERRILRAAIHPTLGVARVGNSPDSFFFGPEVPGALPRARGGFKDSDGAVAKQAARFRVYGLDEAGRPVRELTTADAHIEWRVSVANTKPAWYAFSTPFDIPDSESAPQRNADVRDREKLVIFAGERRVGGAAARPVALGGTFLGQGVGLGELMTDGEGRLVVLPGPRPRLFEGRSRPHEFRGERRVGRRRLRRPGPGDRPDRRANDRSGSGVGARHAPELRAGNADRARHALRRRPLDVRRLRAVGRTRGQLRRRHLPDLRPDDGHAVGQWRLLPEQRLRQ